MVDHTILKPQATVADVMNTCDEALQLKTASVCVNSCWVEAVAQKLQGSHVAVCSVVGFPLGAMLTSSVVSETQHVVRAGAEEIDMVIPLGLVASNEYAAIASHIEAVRGACSGLVLKVILETAVLSAEEIKRACEVAVEAGANFVKTSTGFNAAGGASVEAVSLMRQTVGDSIGVKASGAIRTLSDVDRMVDAGASRLGMSATLAVVKEIESL